MERNQWLGIGFVAPAFVMLAAILGYPAISALSDSVGLGGERVAPGLSSYLRLGGDAEFLGTAKNTALFVLIVVSCHLVLGMAIALLLNADLRARWLFRVVAILPWTMPDVIGGLVFRSLFDTLTGGVNAVLYLADPSLEPIDWLGRPTLAFVAVVLAETWRGYPYVMLILLSGLQTVPKDQYEAASLDGASAWERFRYVTLPNLKTMVIIAVVLDGVWECRLFGMIYGLTGGGPGYSTQNLSLLVYKQYFQFFDTAYAASIAVVLATVLLAAAAPYLRITMRQEA